MYVGKFRDIDDTLYTVKIIPPFTVDDYNYYKLTIDEYVFDQETYIVTGLVAEFTGEYVNFDGTRFTSRGMKFKVISGEQSGREKLEYIYVDENINWEDTDTGVTDLFFVLPEWNQQAYDLCGNQIVDLGLVYREKRDKEIEIQLGAVPVIITQNSDGLFAPIKGLTCTIEVVTFDLLPDLYAQGELDVEVQIYRENNIIFEGYLTPYVYNQPFASVLDTIELEAVSKLSVLKDIKYTPIKGSKNIETVVDILRHIFVDIAKYNKDTFEMHALLKFDLYTEYNLIDSVISYTPSVSESNFFDDDELQTPWSCYDVLSEIAKFFCASFVEYNNIIHIVDYLHIIKYAHHNPTYTRITYDNVYPPIYLLPNIKTVTPLSYFSNDANISYDEIFNKVEVATNTYPVDTLVSSLTDNENLEIGSGFFESNYLKSKNEKKIKWNSIVKWDYRFLNENTGWKHFYYKIPPEVYVDENGETQLRSKETNHWFDIDSTSQYDIHVDYNFTPPRRYPYVNTRCASIVNYSAFQLPATNDYETDIPKQVSYSKCIMFNCFDDSLSTTPSQPFNINYADEHLFNVPMLEYESQVSMIYSPNVSGSHYKTALVINTSILYQCNIKPSSSQKWYAIYPPRGSQYGHIVSAPLDGVVEADPYEFTIYEKYDSEGFRDGTKSSWVMQWPSRTKKESGYGTGYELLKLKLQIGDKYWNGKEWAKEDSTFMLSFNNNPQDGDVETFNCYAWQDIVTNFDYTSEIPTDKGYAIPITHEDCVSGKLKLTIYTPYQLPHAMTISGLVDDFKLPWNAASPKIYLKDFTVDMYCITPATVHNFTDKNADYVYTNIINTNFDKTYTIDELKINTDRGVEAGRSLLSGFIYDIASEEEIRQYLIEHGVIDETEIQNEIGNIVKQKNTNRLLTTLEYNWGEQVTINRRPEEYLIDALTQHYNDKKLIYELTLKQFGENGANISPVHAHNIDLDSVNTFKIQTEAGVAYRVFAVDSYEFDVRNNAIKTKFIQF